MGFIGPSPDWAEFPGAALLPIFERLGVAEVLMGADVVCRNWLRLATGEPRLCRRVDLSESDCFDPTVDMEAMASADGILEHFSSDALLFYVAKRTNSVKSLRLLTCMEVSHKGLVAVGK